MEKLVTPSVEFDRMRPPTMRGAIDRDRSASLLIPLMRRGHRHGAGRAIIGVIALYALLLQAFLGFATPSIAFGADGVLCVEHGSAAPDGKSGAVHKHQCCLPVQPGTLLPPPDSPPEAVAFARVAQVVAWRPTSDVLTTGPPKRTHQPRGPPLV
jgi:hypothetical protein